MSLKEKGGFFLTRACCLINVGHLTKQENKHNSAITEQSTAESVLASIMHIFSFVEWGLSVWIYMDSLFVQVSLHLENKCFILPLLLEKSFFFLRCRCLLLAKYHSSCYPSFSALIICHHMMCLVSCISRF